MSTPSFPQYYSNYTPHYFAQPETIAELCHNLRTYAIDMEYANWHFPWNVMGHPSYGLKIHSGYSQIFGTGTGFPFRLKVRYDFMDEIHFSVVQNWQDRATFCLLYAEYLETIYSDTSIKLADILE